jgi:hypothetical protein
MVAEQSHLRQHCTVEGQGSDQVELAPFPCVGLNWHFPAEAESARRMPHGVAAPAFAAFYERLDELRPRA